DVCVSLPYEAGRPAFESLQPTAEELSALAAGRIEVLPAATTGRPAALLHLERALFSDSAPAPPPLEGAVRFLEGAGMRSALELAAAEILELARDGTPPDRIGVVCPWLDFWRAPLGTVFGAFGVPYSLEARPRLARVPFGSALLALLRFAWLGGGRDDLYS